MPRYWYTLHSHPNIEDFLSEGREIPVELQARHISRKKQPPRQATE
jgi:hypothetical protein